MRHVVGLMIAKGASTRLPGKNRQPFGGQPMFLWSLAKLLAELPEVYFDSDDDAMLAQAAAAGAVPLLRPAELRGHEVPSVPLFQNMVRQMAERPGAVLNLQANSPTTSPETIRRAAGVMRHTDCTELQTVFPDTHEPNGSLWGFSTERLMGYGDPRVHRPDVLLIDTAVDVHTTEDLERARTQQAGT